MAANNDFERKERQIFAGGRALHFRDSEVQGRFADLDGERFYSIRNVDRMAPFFISVISDSNHWMFISSNGGLTAGRKNSESSLFPYYTDDKITESAEITGSKTLLRVLRDRKTFLWEPFSQRYAGIYQIERNIREQNSFRACSEQQTEHFYSLRTSH